MFGSLIRYVPKNFMAKKLYNHFTAGETIKTLENKIEHLNKSNLLAIPDLIKEKTENPNEIDKIVQEYKDLAESKKFKFVAVKLSSFDFDYVKINNVIEHMISKNKTVMIDAEEVDVQDKINDMTNCFLLRYNKNKINIYKTYQMYREDSLDRMKKDISTHPFLGIKLVRGAYHSKDYNTLKLYIKKDETDRDYEKAMDIISEQIKSNSSKNQLNSFICTHNQKNISQIIEKSNNFPMLKDNLFHASLYGFIQNDTQRLIDSKISTYKYLPYGQVNDSIPYLMRRLEENPKIIKYLFT